ncbi:MAG: hypothetical protein IPN16_25920 [Gemmatimonadetes bacterium]|nr:hypothetical protein [Gemmatimonadota bacterium]
MGTTATIVAFVIATAAFQAGLQFYDALLPEVSTDENRRRISASASATWDPMPR